jgi:large subunit ribosomal protein L27
MAHRKAGGSAKNLRDSKPKFLGVKKHDGETVRPGMIIIRQRGTRILPGTNTGLGKDHTIFARTGGQVKFSEKRKTGFDGRVRRAKIVSVI